MQPDCSFLTRRFAKSWTSYSIRGKIQIFTPSISCKHRARGMQRSLTLPIGSALEGGELDAEGRWRKTLMKGEGSKVVSYSRIGL